MSSKQKRILRDNIAGIRKPSIGRLAMKAGILSLDGLVYEEVRGMMKVMIADIVEKAFVFASYAQRKNINAVDVVMGIKYAFGVDPVVGILKKRSGVQAMVNPATPHVTRVKKRTENPESDRKAPRFKQGTVVRRNIAKRQKEHGAVYIPVSPFRRFVMEIVQDVTGKSLDGIRKDASSLIHYFVEYRMMCFFKKALIIAEASGRSRVKPTDLIAARVISGNEICSRPVTVPKKKGKGKGKK